MRILIWHVHGAWTTAFVQGRHEYLIPTTPDRGPYGLGRAATYPWPASAIEVAPHRLRAEHVDVVVLQRPEEEALARRWLGRRVPTVYVEHNTPKGDVPNTRHPMADRDDLTLVHVTHFNELFWDNGGTRTVVIEHGIPEPAARYTGELPRIAVAVNEPVRRGRVTGTDLLPAFAALAPLDVYGMRVTGLGTVGDPNDPAAEPPDPQAPVTTYEDPPQHAMHAAVSRRRMYLHPMRWTSLGLSLLEAMAMGCPVLALATTEAVDAVPPAAGALSISVADLVEAARGYLLDPVAATRAGRAARRAVTARYGLDRFLSDWDVLLDLVAGADRRWAPARTGAPTAIGVPAV